MCIIVLVNSFLRRILVVLPFRDLRQPGESSDRGEQIAWPLVVSTTRNSSIISASSTPYDMQFQRASYIHDGAREEIPVNVSPNSRHERPVQLDDVDGGIGEIGPAPRSRYRSRRPHAGRLAPAPSSTGRDALASSIRAPSVTRVPTSLRGNRCAPAQAGVSSTNAEVRNCSGNSLPTAPEPFPAWGCEPMSALSIRSAAVCPS